MKRIGILSDTHGEFDDKLYDFFKDVDEIWHAGDIGTIEIADKLAEFKPLRAVYGNCDGMDIRSEYPKFLRFKIEELDVFLIHIGGYPGRYDFSVREYLQNNPPDLFVCGHSHILKVINDKKLNLLHINPGATGNRGIHKVKTLIRFKIEGKRMFDLEILEIPRKQ
ncbi:MAG: metallophosphoesterase family protein [Bacteroidales bacterium]|nr:metallophosphoesterase family protein [Bacteroidales bacterium]